ncbi:MAG TPA: PAS domain S-box protein, partial [Elusimicrobiota bacterium]|nr:PAS domain S-box protein [Elusimicrobiota bacterium]
MASYSGVSAVIVGACAALEKHPMIVGSACILAAAVCGYLFLDSIMLKRKRIDQALRGNAEWYLNLFESALNAIVIIDGKTHRVEDVNTAALALYGYTKEEFLRLRVEDISAEPERTRESLDQRVVGMIRDTIPLIRHKKKSGQVFPVEIATSVCLVEGRKKGIGVIRDLTESLEQEREIKRSERRYRSLFENSHDALMTTEFPSELFSSANAATVAMFRAKNEAEFLSRTPGELSPEFQPDGRPSKEKAQELMGATLFEGCQHFEWMHKRFDGEEFPTDVLLTRTELDGKIIIQATVRDLTETRRTRDERNLLSTAIEQASECVVITDAAARIIYVNPAFERVTGYSRAEAQGRKTSLLKSGRHDASFYKEMWATLARGEVWRGHLFNRRKDGTVYEEDTSITPVR